MDRALLERMVGAVALVLLLVIVAPALLDGTSEPGVGKFAVDPDGSVRTQVIVLNEPRTVEAPETAAQIDRAAEVVAAERSPTEVPAAAQDDPEHQDVSASVDRRAKAEAAPVSQVAAPQGKDAAKPKTNEAMPGGGSGRMDAAVVADAGDESFQPPPVPASGRPAESAGFAVQLGSFGQIGNAKKYAADVGARGFAVFVRSSSSSSGGVHRVYAGPRPNREAAAQLAAVLGEAGYKGIVVDLSAASGGGH